MPNAPEREPVLDALVERALAPYRDLLPAATIAVMREELELAYTTHPVAARLIARIRERAPTVESEELVRGEDGRFHTVPTSEGGERSGGRRAR